MKSDILIHSFHFFKSRLPSPVGEYKPVYAEIAIAWHSFFTKVTTVGPEFFSVLISCEKALIDPVPDETSLQQGILLNNIPVILKVSHRVTHSVSIFAQNKGTIALRVLCVLFDLRYPCIHGAYYICMPFGCICAFFSAFILNRPCYISFFGPFVIGNEVLAIASFIAKRPDYYRRMILVAFNHSLHPVHMR